MTEEGKYINLTEILKSAFTDSKLNAAFQKAVVADGTVNWSAMPDVLMTDSEITGLDRSNAEEDTSEWLELMISKKKCSVEEANAILNLLLIGVVNESTGEERYINEYDDKSGHIAVLMNLAKDALKIVPMKDMGWKNDGQGDRPKEFDEWVRELAEGLLELITALIGSSGGGLEVYPGGGGGGHAAHRIDIKSAFTCLHLCIFRNDYSGINCNGRFFYYVFLTISTTFWRSNYI